MEDEKTEVEWTVPPTATHPGVKAGPEVMDWGLTASATRIEVAEPEAGDLVFSGDCAPLFEALAKAQGAITPPKKSRTAHMGAYTYSYADLADCVAAIREPFSKNGLAFLQPFSRLSVDGALMVCVTTTIAHASGAKITCLAYAKPTQNTPQGVGSTITYLRRYAMGMVGLVTEKDDDGLVGSVKADDEGWGDAFDSAQGSLDSKKRAQKKK